MTKQHHIRGRKPAIGAAIYAAAIGGGCLATAPALAEMNIHDDGFTTLSLSVKGGLGVFSVSDANFGAGLTKPGGRVIRDLQWAEEFLAPGLTGTMKLGGAGSLYGGISALGAATQGDGDAAGTTFGGAESVELEDAMLGWRSGDLLPALGTDALDLSFGRQSFALGDGFLLADGNADGGRHAAYWMGARTAWQNSAIARINTQPVRADLFALRSDTDTNRDEIAGLNLEYVHPERGTVGISYMEIVDSRAANRDGMQVYSLRGQGNPLAAVPDLFLSAEVALERNDSAAADVEAYAWYLEAGYTFSQLPWTPGISYRFSQFSGDEAGTAENEAFDALHYGMTRPWGTWFQGEVVGEYMWGNSNLNVHKLHLTAAPLEGLTVGAIYYRFDLDQATGLPDSHLADEIDLHADYQLTPEITVSGVYGWATPGDGGKAVFGGSDDSHVAQLITTFAF